MNTSTNSSWRGGKHTNTHLLGYFFLAVFPLHFYCIRVLCVFRTVQYGQMEMSTNPEGTETIKKIMEAGGEKGLLNLPAEETVFYVGGYPSTFSVSNAEHLSMEGNRIETRDCGTFDLSQ